MVELAGIIILGILAQWFAWKFKLPAILPLILIGLLVGPIATLISADETSYIQPIWDGTRGLFPGENLFYFVSLAIGIILFEGGLTLKRDEVSKVGPAIIKLISIGAGVTFVGAGVATHYLIALNWPLSFLFAALIIVTGPTVISPILRNIPLKKDVSAVLKWEGILIDPIGALAAVLVYEFIVVGGDFGYSKQAVMEFGKILLIGFSFGLSGGYALYFSIKRRWVPHYLLNVVALSVVLMVFIQSDLFAHESGLLAVVVMGMFLGNSNLPNLKELLYFKESLSVLLISILFILLSANIQIDDLRLIYNWQTAALLGVVIFVLRPLSVFLSTMGSTLKFNEKLFISWVGPRGIVAAGIASLFGTRLVVLGVPNAEYITPLVFSVVLVTVLLNATTARFFASLVGVFLKSSNGVLIIGASKLSRLIASYLQKNGRQVVLVDSNQANIIQAQALGLEAFSINIYTDDLTANAELNTIGYLLALTGSAEINQQAISRLSPSFGQTGTFRLMSPEEKQKGVNLDNPQYFSNAHDYVTLDEVARQHPSIQEIPISSQKQFLNIWGILKNNQQTVPLFLKRSDGFLDLINAPNNTEVGPGSHLVYLGKPQDVEELRQLTSSKPV
ncbi:MAG: cation:proton antiporter [Flavobacteriaceae bacterium]|nr:cation:proton antiporter [Flavobacteriaceae bacterium]MDG1962573.1 cation:proton antiporter [Flavobacteriaceae bacterium]